MARPPRPNQKRYRGRIRASMRSALNHLGKLSTWQAKYLAGPVTAYPNQLMSAADWAIIANGIAQLALEFGYKGPIPSR